MSRNLHQEVTDRIVAAIEIGMADGNAWKMPWHHVGAIGYPSNAITRRAYRGVNVLTLMFTAAAAGYPTHQWATFKQWQERGAMVRKGEKGSQVVYYGTLNVRDADTSEDDGKTVHFLKHSHVFNAAQVEGWEAPPIIMPDLAERIACAEHLVACSGAEIKYGVGRAYYQPAGDFIGMPAWEAFKDTATSTATEAAYGTLLHELTHWTGAEKRCNRDLKNRFGSEAYAGEELVAELGAAFLCAKLGITAEPRIDHAHYIASWLEALKNDPRAIFTAAARASDAVEYLERLVPNVGEERVAA